MQAAPPTHTHHAQRQHDAKQEMETDRDAGH